MGAVAWRKVFVWALAGTAIAVALTLANLASTFDSLGGLVDAGPNDKAAPILAADLPDYPLAEGGRHDGQQFYVIARQPMHPTEAAVGLDKPAYRLQRILFPVLAWALHPSGGGEGLVWAMFAVGVAGVLAGAVATGALSMQLGGPAWPAILFGAWIGTTTALRISTPDPLALAFVLWALWFLLRERLAWAVAFAIAAVLTRETGLVLLAGFFLWRRDRNSAIATIVPAAVAGAWWLWLRMQFPGGENQTVAFDLPFAGWIEAVRFWGRGYEPLGLVAMAIALGLGVLALIRGGLRHPFGWSILLSLAMYTVLIGSAIAPERNPGRTTMGSFILSVIVLVTYKTAPDALARMAPSEPMPASSGPDGSDSTARS